MTLPASAVEIRPALVEDLPFLADFINRANMRAELQCLYCPAGSAASVRATLRNAEEFPGGWELSFVVAVMDGEIMATLGCQFDPERTLGCLWGPWAGPEPHQWSVIIPALFDRLLFLLPSSMHRLDAFVHAENRNALCFLQTHGFRSGPLTYIYVLPRNAWRVMGAGNSACPALRPAHEIAFARLHSDTFPVGASTPAGDLLAGRDGEHVIFTAADGLRLLGYVCASVNRAPREGFIDYLAVKPTARGRGIGTRLLQTALRWTFEEKHLPQAALCVSEWRDGARRFYERSGFALSVSGVGARRDLRQRSMPSNDS